MDVITIKPNLLLHSNKKELQSSSISFSDTTLRFTEQNGNTVGTYVSAKRTKLSTVGENELKIDCIDERLINVSRHHILSRFTFYKPSRNKVFKNLRMQHFKIANFSLLNILVVHLEDDWRKNVKYSAQTKTITLMLMKVESAI